MATESRARSIRTISSFVPWATKNGLPSRGLFWTRSSNPAGTKPARMPVLRTLCGYRNASTLLMAAPWLKPITSKVFASIPTEAAYSSTRWISPSAPTRNCSKVGRPNWEASNGGRQEKPLDSTGYGARGATSQYLAGRLRPKTHIEFSSPVNPWIMSMSRQLGSEASRMRSVQLLKSTSVELFRSCTAEDPIDGQKDTQDEDNGSESRKQAHKCHAPGSLAIDQPDQADPHN